MLANDDKAISKALGIIDLSPDDVDLSKEELVAFIRGRTLSGGLEIASFEGYYETEPLGGQVFALLILSVGSRIFWGPVEGFFAKNWSNSEVKYQLKSDTTISFTSTAGDVVLSFSRDFDDDSGVVGKSDFNVRSFGYLQRTDCLTISNRVLSTKSTSPELKQPFQSSSATDSVT